MMVDLSRTQLEAVASVAYRTGAITTTEVQEMLGFQTRREAEIFLRRARKYHRYTMEELAWEVAGTREGLR
jgi:hypothetical protein